MPLLNVLSPRYAFVLLLLAALAISALASRYYRHNFGIVEPQRRVRTVVGFTVFVAALVLAVSMQDAYQTPFAPPMLVIAGALAYLGIAGGHVRTHYIVLAGLTIAFAAIGPLGASIATRSVLLDNLIGVGLIVIGVGDHLVLRRTLQPVSHARAI